MIAGHAVVTTWTQVFQIAEIIDAIPGIIDAIFPVINAIPAKIDAITGIAYQKPACPRVSLLVQAGFFRFFAHSSSFSPKLKQKKDCLILKTIESNSLSSRNDAREPSPCFTPALFEAFREYAQVDTKYDWQVVVGEQDD